MRQVCVMGTAWRSRDLEAGWVAAGRKGGGDGKKPGRGGGLGPECPGPARPHGDKEPLEALKPAWGDTIDSVLCTPPEEKPQAETSREGQVDVGS